MASVKVIMPVMGMNQETGLVLKWLAKEGETVKKGQILVEIETDKAVAEIDAPADGVLTQILAQEGESVPVGQAAAVITPLGELPELKNPAPSPIPVVPSGEVAAQKCALPMPFPASPVAARMAAEQQIDLSLVRPTGGRIEKADILAYLQFRSSLPAQVGDQPARALASPKARRMAAERGLDLRALHGSGPQGAVLAPDVEAFNPSTPSSATFPEINTLDSPAAASSTRDSAEDEVVLSSAGRIMAERTTATWQTTPHFYLLREVDAGQLLAWRESAQKNSTTKITLTDLLIKLCAASLVKRPSLNVQFQDGKLLRLPAVHVGFAAALENGLVVPVVHHADQKGLSEIAQARTALLERGRAGRLRPEDIAEGSLTISNLGMFGVDAFNAIINGSQASILAVGRVAERVVARGGQPVVRPTIILSLSCDHRAVDGAHAAEFLDTLAGLIEDPLRLVS
jgi:pyruvate dehydrogenase E2 component (dihydrolipoamide acetyltransferase)